MCLTLLGGCKPSRQEVIASIIRAEQRSAKSYYGTDPEAAARDLVLYQHELLSRRKQVADAYRYDFVLGMACARLALIYESIGQNNQAAAQMRESLSYFQRESVTHHLKASDITEQSTREFIARLDGKRTPVWQKPQLEQPARTGPRLVQPRSVLGPPLEPALGVSANDPVGGQA